MYAWCQNDFADISCTCTNHNFRFCIISAFGQWELKDGIRISYHDPLAWSRICVTHFFQLHRNVETARTMQCFQLGSRERRLEPYFHFCKKGFMQMTKFVMNGCWAVKGPAVFDQVVAIDKFPQCLLQFRRLFKSLCARSHFLRDLNRLQKQLSPLFSFWDFFCTHECCSPPADMCSWS